MKTEIAIVGAGIGGLLTSLVSDGYKKVILERRKGVGKNCSGIVSYDTFTRLVNISSLIKEHLVSEYKEIIINIDGKPSIYISGKPVSIRLERTTLDKELAKITNTEIIFKTSSIIEGNLIRTNKGLLVQSDLIIDSTGINKEGIISIESTVRENEEENEETINVYLFKNKKGSFFWKFKSLGKTYIGALGDKVTYNDLMWFIKKYSKTHELLETHGGLVGRYNEINLVRGNILYIGDSSGLSKPLTGGGLFSISKQLEILKQKGFNANSYRGEIKNLVKEIRNQRLALRLGTKFWQLLFTIVKRKQLNIEIETKDFDFHISTLVKLIKATL